MLVNGDRGRIMKKINVLEREVTVVVEGNEDFICITDIARYRIRKGPIT